MSDRLASHLGLDAAQRAAMDQAFQMFFREFRTLEAQHTRPKDTDENGHQITTIDAFRPQLAQLEQRFWSELETVLDGHGSGRTQAVEGNLREWSGHRTLWHWFEKGMYKLDATKTPKIFGRTRKTPSGFGWFVTDIVPRVRSRTRDPGLSCGTPSACANIRDAIQKQLKKRAMKLLRPQSPTPARTAAN